MAKETPIKNTVRNTSKSWVTTKFLMTSTSEVHLWIISPVWFLSCQAEGSLCTWAYRAFRIFSAKFSPALAVKKRLKNMAAPDSIATPTRTPAITQRCSARYGYLSPSRTESIVKRNICGVRELKTVVIKEAMTATIKYLFAPLKKRRVSCIFLFFILLKTPSCNITGAPVQGQQLPVFLYLIVPQDFLHYNLLCLIHCIFINRI